MSAFVAVDVVCVNYRTEALLPAVNADVIRLITHGIRPRFIIVDCSGGVTDEVEASLSEALVLRPGRNLGFGAAVNLAVREAATAPVLLLVNPDVRLEAAPVSAVVHTVANGNAVAATGRLRHADGTRQANTAPAPTLTGLVLEYLLGRDLRLSDCPKVRDVTVASGALLAVDLEAFTAVGGFDERYPLYAEDFVLSLSLGRHGPIRQLPVECGIHVGGVSAATASESSYLLLHATRVAYFRTRSRFQGRVARGVVLVGQLLRKVMGRPVTIRRLMAATSPNADLHALLPGPGEIASHSDAARGDT